MISDKIVAILAEAEEYHLRVIRDICVIMADTVMPAFEEVLDTPSDNITVMEVIDYNELGIMISIAVEGSDIGANSVMHHEVPELDMDDEDGIIHIKFIIPHDVLNSTVEEITEMLISTITEGVDELDEQELEDYIEQSSTRHSDDVSKQQSKTFQFDLDSLTDDQKHSLITTYNSSNLDKVH